MSVLVRFLLLIFFPVAYPISKVRLATSLPFVSSNHAPYNHPKLSFILRTRFKMLDCLLGKAHSALYRRAELKTLVDLHANEVGLHLDPLSSKRILNCSHNDLKLAYARPGKEGSYRTTRRA